MNFMQTHITEVLHPSPEYALIRFQGPVPIEGAPGQFVMIRGDFGNDPILPRAFSLVESGETGAVLVRKVGKATSRLVALRASEPLSVLGPLGNGFDLPQDGVHPVLVGGGVGVAPMIFLSETLHKQGIENTFVYGGRTNLDLLFLDRIQQSAALFTTTEDGSAGVKGRVTDVLETALKGKTRIAMYACGPEPMLHALARYMENCEGTLHVALEQAMACGMGTCKGCAVHAADGKFRYVCSDGPVFDAKTIYGGVR
jgi:dihydroorotate dehydrogenase electron transfer subunit